MRHDREMWRTWGGDDYADPRPAAWYRACVAHGQSVPSRRTPERYYRDGLRLVTETGSKGWPGFFCLSETGMVTHVESIHAGLAQHAAALSHDANARRGAKMRAARWISRDNALVSPAGAAPVTTDPSSGSSSSPIVSSNGPIASPGPSAPQDE
jgi:hypothetical protein